MPFDPNDPVVKLCLQAMALQGEQKSTEAAAIRQKAWDESRTDFDRFLVAYYLARHAGSADERMRWLEQSLECANRSDDPSARTAVATLHAEIVEAHEARGDADRAAKQRALAAAAQPPRDPGPFFHGTKADVPVGELLTPRQRSNYQRDLIMNHVYFTALVNGAGLAAELAQGEGRERVYIVEPTGSFEDDPNVTNKRFPGNLTRSYRSAEPLKVVGELSDWPRRSAEEIAQWRARIAKLQGEIIN